MWMTSSSQDQIHLWFITELSEVFELKDMGKLTYFLGLQIQYKANGDIFG